LNLVAFATSSPKSTFKALLQLSPTLLQVIKMSLEKQVPLTLHHYETECGQYGKSAPIRYILEQDPVQGSLSKATVSTLGGALLNLKLESNGKGIL
jgi:hypothetical protein